MTRPFAEIFTDAVSAATAPGDRRLTAIKFLTDLADVEEGHGHGGALEMIAAATVAQPFIAFLLSSPPASPGPVDTDRILAAITELETTIMSRLTDTAAKLSGDDAQLLIDIEAVLAQNEAAAQARINAAVKTALDAAGVADDAQADILDATDTAVAAEHVRLQAIINPPAGATPADGAAATPPADQPAPDAPVV